MSEGKPSYQDFVIKDGILIGDFEGLYKNVDDPWHQSRRDHIFDTRRQICILACQNAKNLFGSNRILEVGCGFGFLTDQIAKLGFETLGTDISPAAIDGAFRKNPNSNFKVAPYNDFGIIQDFNPDIIIMSEITWYVLDSLDNFLINIKSFAKARKSPFFLIHLLSTYEDNVQKYGRDKFTNLAGIKAYFDLNYLEAGYIEVKRPDDAGSQGTYFIAQIS
jgi:SAM-dependent methyltransferase